MFAHRPRRSGARGSGHRQGAGRPVPETGGTGTPPVLRARRAERRGGPRRLRARRHAAVCGRRRLAQARERDIPGRIRGRRHRRRGSRRRSGRRDHRTRRDRGRASWQRQRCGPGGDVRRRAGRDAAHARERSCTFARAAQPGADAGACHRHARGANRRINRRDCARVRTRAPHCTGRPRRSPLRRTRLGRTAIRTGERRRVRTDGGIRPDLRRRSRIRRPVRAALRVGARACRWRRRPGNPAADDRRSARRAAPSAALRVADGHRGPLQSGFGRIHRSHRPEDRDRPRASVVGSRRRAGARPGGSGRTCGRNARHLERDHPVLAGRRHRRTAQGRAVRIADLRSQPGLPRLSRFRRVPGYRAHQRAGADAADRAGVHDDEAARRSAAGRRRCGRPRRRCTSRRRGHAAGERIGSCPRRRAPAAYLGSELQERRSVPQRQRHRGRQRPNAEPGLEPGGAQRLSRTRAPAHRPPERPGRQRRRRRGRRTSGR